MLSVMLECGGEYVPSFLSEMEEEQKRRMMEALSFEKRDGPTTRMILARCREEEREAERRQADPQLSWPILETELRRSLTAEERRGLREGSETDIRRWARL